MLRAGDEVRLKKGGTTMVVLVVALYENRIMAQCRWWENDIFISGVYDVTQLTAASPADYEARLDQFGTVD